MNRSQPPRILDLSTYGALLVMGVLGVAGLDGVGPRVAGSGLCATYGLVYAWSTTSPRSHRALMAAFVVQTGAVALALALHSEIYEAFGFLLMVLAVHAAVVFGTGEAVASIAVLWTIHAVATFAFLTSEAPYVVVFNLGIYLLCGVVGYALRTSVESRDALEDALDRLRDAQDRIRTLAADTERGRLARDLHDSVKQQVFASGMQIGAARALLPTDPAAADDALGEAAELTRRAGTELRMVIHELQPSDVGDTGLVEALRVYLDRWTRQTGISGTTHVFPDDAELHTDREVEEALMRVAQESLANVARHSHAESVEIHVGVSDSVELTVSDDGIGFDPAGTTDGYGLRSMRERIDQLGGTLEITTRREGTSVRARIGETR